MNTDGSIIEKIYYDEPERGWKTSNKDYVTSIVFEMKEPIKIKSTVSRDWVLLVEPQILDEVQIVSIDKNTPIGWRLGEGVYEDHPAHDKEAIIWLAENYERI